MFSNVQKKRWIQKKAISNQVNDESSGQPFICFKCKKLGHKKNECPKLKKRFLNKTTKRRAIMAT